MNEETDTKTFRFNLQTFVRLFFLALIFSLSVQTPFIYYQNLRFSLTDFIFPPVSILFFLSVILKKIDFRWHKFYLFLLFYFAAMLISAVFSINPKQSFVKLSGETYLLGLVVLTFNLIRTKKDFKQAILMWLFGAALTISVSFLTIILFYFQPENPVLPFTTSIYGAVPVGNYPRLTSVFVSASMYCNFLTVSLILLFIAEKLKYIGQKAFWILFFLTVVCAVFTASSGLGGIVLAIGFWIWLKFKNSYKSVSKFSLIAGISAAILFAFINFCALAEYPNAPFSIKIPFIQSEFLPSSRFLVWSASFHTFTANLLTGIGLGQNVCEITFQNTDGNLSFLTDAHNIFLSVAAQNGILGLSAISAIIFYFLRKLSYFNFDETGRAFLTNSLLQAFFCAFFYQGLFGSFEDTRHLWVLTGFILASETIEEIPDLACV